MSDATPYADPAERVYTYVPRLDGLTGVRIVVVGAGGTASHLWAKLAGVLYAVEDARQAAIPLPEHALGRLPVSLAACDPDVVEEKNVGRQFFFPRDVGHFKSIVTAGRYKERYGLPIEHHVRYFTDAPSLMGDADTLTVLVSCVDNTAARREMHATLGTSVERERHGYVERVRRRVVLIDCGNERAAGQVFVGTTMEVDDLRDSFSPLGLVGALPAPGLVAPALLAHEQPSLAAEARPDDCAARVLRGEQAITINMHVAAAAMQILADLLLGELRHFGVFVKATAGLEAVPLALTPANVAAFVSGYARDAYDLGLLPETQAPKRKAPRVARQADAPPAPPVAFVRAVEAPPSAAVGEAPATGVAAPQPPPRPPLSRAGIRKRRLRSHRADARHAGQGGASTPARDRGVPRAVERRARSASFGRRRRAEAATARDDRPS